MSKGMGAQRRGRTTGSEANDGVPLGFCDGTCSSGPTDIINNARRRNIINMVEDTIRLD